MLGKDAGLCCESKSVSEMKAVMSSNETEIDGRNQEQGKQKLLFRIRTWVTDLLSTWNPYRRYIIYTLYTTRLLFLRTAME